MGNFNNKESIDPNKYQQPPPNPKPTPEPIPEPKPIPVPDSPPEPEPKQYQKYLLSPQNEPDKNGEQVWGVGVSKKMLPARHILLCVYEVHIVN